MKIDILQLVQRLAKRINLDCVVKEDHNRIRDQIVNYGFEIVDDAFVGCQHVKWFDIKEKTNPTVSGLYMVYCLTVGLGLAEYNFEQKNWRNFKAFFNGTTAEVTSLTHWLEMIETPILKPEQKEIEASYVQYTTRYPGLKISVDQFEQIWNHRSRKF